MKGRRTIPPADAPVEEACGAELPGLPEEDPMGRGGLIDEEVGMGRNRSATHVGPERVSGPSSLFEEGRG